MPPERVLLTGISGFIAKHCAVELLNAGYRVRGTVRSPAARDAVRTTLGRHADVSGLEFAEADLLADEHWGDAVAGCSAVLHVASPFPNSQPRDENVLIRPAVDGTLRVLRAAAAAGVQRFVHTSSTVAVMYGHPPERTAPYTETDWTPVEAPGVTAYAKSKTLAERAARAFIDKDRSGLRYASVNPGLVLGPALDRDVGASAEIIQMFLKGKYPACPRLSFPCVDVRDVARMHRLALEADGPPGARYLGVSESIWMLDMARAIKTSLGAVARKVPTRPMPDWVLRLVAIFDPIARQAVPDLGRWYGVDNTQTRRALGMEFIPASKAATDMADSLVKLGLV
jgi:dihydroflavonol-4-reductase